MIAGLAASVKTTVADTAKRSVMGLLGGILAMLGVAFLTSAAWILLTRLSSSLTAALVIGLFYLIVGGVVLVVGTRRRVPEIPAQPVIAAPPLATASLSMVPALVEAFFFGMNAASNARRAHRARAAAAYDEFEAEVATNASRARRARAAAQADLRRSDPSRPRF